MNVGSATSRRSRRLVVTALTSALIVVASTVPASAIGARPDVDAAVHYLTTTKSANGVVDGPTLATDGYYEAFDQFGDFGLTIDGAFALAAAHDDQATYAKVVAFIKDGGTDESNRSVKDWTGIGTPYASGGAIGKEALLAEIAGYDPRAFGGQDLIAAIDAVVCTTTDVVNGCAGPGNYLYSTSTFSQSLGVIAQLRAGDTANAAPAIAYLEGLQNSAGAFPSLIPPTGDSDVDSTAMATMALALVGGDATASAEVTKAVAWIATKQSAKGGFPGVAADSANSTGLAIQGLNLAGSTYSAQIAKALAFLAAQQNADGGFDAAAGSGQGSDVRASAQVVGGVAGTSFGTLSNVISSGGGGTTTTIAPSTSTTTPTSTTVTTSTVSVPVTPNSVAGVTTGQLPVTGTGAGRSLVFVVALLVLGSAAMVAGRKRRSSTG